MNETIQPTDDVTSRPNRRDERGASLVEYALLLSLIAIVLAGTVSTFGGKIDDSLDNANSAIASASVNP